MNIEKLKIKTSGIHFVGKELVDYFNEFKITNDNTYIIEVITLDDYNNFVAFVQELDSNIDHKIWVLYPKGTSKKYKAVCEVNRTTFIKGSENLSFRPVSQVSVSDDFTATRIRFKQFVNAK